MILPEKLTARSDERAMKMLQESPADPFVVLRSIYIDEDFFCVNFHRVKADGSEDTL